MATVPTKPSQSVEARSLQLVNTTPHGPNPASLASRHDADMLANELDRATAAANLAAGCLAYDVTIRAANPNGEGGVHERATPQLTARLKAEYVVKLEHQRALNTRYHAALAAAEAAESVAGYAVTR